jgi:hypothetical protein
MDDRTTFNPALLWFATMIDVIYCKHLNEITFWILIMGKIWH